VTGADDPAKDCVRTGARTALAGCNVTPDTGRGWFSSYGLPSGPIGDHPKSMDKDGTNRTWIRPPFNGIADTTRGSLGPERRAPNERHDPQGPKRGAFLCLEAGQLTGTYARQVNVILGRPVSSRPWGPGAEESRGSG
jgi:hypothetical protein